MICIEYKTTKVMIFTNNGHRIVVALFFILGIYFIVVFTNNDHTIAVTLFFVLGIYFLGL